MGTGQVSVCAGVLSASSTLSAAACVLFLIVAAYSVGVYSVWRCDVCMILFTLCPNHSERYKAEKRRTEAEGADDTGGADDDGGMVEDTFIYWGQHTSEKWFRIQPTFWVDGGNGGTGGVYYTCSMG